jgi:hypothetical protein
MIVVRRLLVFGCLAVLLVSVYAGVAARSGHFGYPLDDAWIHQTYARNWAATGQLAYLAGVPSAGSTAPLWTLLLSVAYRLQIDHYLWSMLLGAITLAISAWLLSRLADRLVPASRRSLVSWLVGLACVIEWHLVWAAASGMETLLFVALALALIDRVWAESSGWIVGALGGLLILTRPEGLLLFALALTVMVIRSGRSGLIGVLKAVVAFAIVLAPGVYFNLQAGGSIFPNTFYAKQSEYGELTSSLSRWLSSIGNMLIAPLAGGLLLLLPGVVWWGVTSLRGALSPSAPPRRARTGRAMKQSRVSLKIASRKALAMTAVQWLPPIWIAAHIGVYALRLPVSYQHGRYLLPIIPIVLLYGIVGSVQLLDAIKARSAKPVTRLLRRTYALTIAIVFVAFVPIGALAFATDVDVINNEMVTVAQWLDRHTPPDAIIAAHDIGAIGYFAQRPILDLAGLISPEVIPFIRDEDQLGEWMQTKGAYYFVTFPGWYPQLKTRWPPVFTGNSAFSPEHMTIYVLKQ